MTDEILAKKEQVEALLPEELTLEGDAIVHHEKEDWGIVFVQKNGSHRINKKDATLVVDALQQVTKKSWCIDSISNFVIHYGSLGD